jgi:hypothetical protein
MTPSSSLPPPRLVKVNDFTDVQEVLGVSPYDNFILVMMLATTRRIEDYTQGSASGSGDESERTPAFLVGSGNRSLYGITKYDEYHY